jgi:hypothetical protein
VRSCSELGTAVDRLQSLAPSSLADGELTQLLLDVDDALARLTAAHARLAAAVETRRTWEADGSKSCSAWLARQRQGSQASTGAALRLGRALNVMPGTDAALADGHIAVEHARELASCQRFAPDEFADDEKTLLRHAQELSWRSFLIVCAHWRNAVDPDGAERAADKLHDRRHLLVHRRPDGSLSVQSGLLDPIGAEAFLNELERIDQELFEHDWSRAKAEHGDDTTVAKLGRTAAQRRADALVEMAHRARTAPADGLRPEPLVSVYVDYETATGRLCELASGVPITPGQLLPVFAVADVERVVFGPSNREIELGTRARFFTGGLRRAIQLRDRRCQWPGCNAPARRCQVDHEDAYEDGGLTVQDNGRCLCPYHHRLRSKGQEPPPPDGSDDADVDRLRRLCRVRLRGLLRDQPGQPSSTRPTTTSRSTSTRSGSAGRS